MVENRVGAGPEVRPYSRAHIQRNADHFGRMLAMHILGKTPLDMAEKLETSARTIRIQLNRLTATRESSDPIDWMDIFNDDLRMWGRFNWHLTPKGRALLGLPEYQSSKPH